MVFPAGGIGVEDTPAERSVAIFQESAIKSIGWIGGIVEPGIQDAQNVRTYVFDCAGSFDVVELRELQFLRCTLHHLRNDDADALRFVSDSLDLVNCF